MTGLGTMRGVRVRLVPALVLFSAGVASAGDKQGRVTIVRAPEGAIQPQAVVDRSGAVHLVVYTGDLSAGDVRYTRIEPGKSGFSPLVRVNKVPGDAIARGTIRGAQLALGRNGRLHVAWNGSGKAGPANPNGGVPMLYTRSDEGATTFEPERNLMTRTSALDGGGTVAADARGRVLVAWHARPLNATEGEAGRRMFVARSTDDGATFAPEEPALEEPTGACACCGTRGLIASDGSAYLLYRTATGGTDRDLMLLTSRPGADHYSGRRLHPWKLNMCPMSSESMVEGPRGVVAAWETQGQVYFTRIDPATGSSSTPVHPRGSGGNRKHPAVAANARGEILLAWAEDTSFQKGGALVWRVFDAEGKATEETGRVEGGIPVSSLPTALARPDGGFTLVH